MQEIELARGMSADLDRTAAWLRTVATQRDGMEFIASMFVMQAVVGRGTPFNSRYLARTCALHSSGVQIRMGHGPRRRYRYPLRTCSAYG